jgi:hypothetical protein
MPAPLYARYVPPKPLNTPAEPPQSSPFSAGKIHPSPTPQLYARYIPPKSSKRAIEPSASVNLREEAGLTDSNDAKSTSKKRKRPVENYAHKDRKALIDSFSNAANSSDHDPSGDELDSKKERKDKKRKRMKAEAIEPALETGKAPAKWPQDRTASPAAADSILAKYSVTAGTRRTTFLEQRSETESKQLMEVEVVDEDDVDGKHMDTDALDGEQNDDEAQHSEGSNEEITPAGVEAIFQKYRKSTQPDLKARRVNGKQEREGANGEEQELELHGRLYIAPQSSVTKYLQAWNLSPSPQEHPRPLTSPHLTLYLLGLRNRPLYLLLPLLLLPT